MHLGVEHGLVGDRVDPGLVVTVDRRCLCGRLLHGRLFRGRLPGLFDLRAGCVHQTCPSGELEELEHLVWNLSGGELHLEVGALCRRRPALQLEHAMLAGPVLSAAGAPAPEHAGRGVLRRGAGPFEHEDAGPLPVAVEAEPQEHLQVAQRLCLAHQGHCGFDQNPQGPTSLDRRGGRGDLVAKCESCVVW